MPMKFLCTPPAETPQAEARSTRPVLKSPKGVRVPVPTSPSLPHALPSSAQDFEPRISKWHTLSWEHRMKDVNPMLNSNTDCLPPSNDRLVLDRTKYRSRSQPQFTVKNTCTLSVTNDNLPGQGCGWKGVHESESMTVRQLSNLNPPS